MEHWPKTKAPQLYLHARMLNDAEAAHSHQSLPGNLYKMVMPEVLVHRCQQLSERRPVLSLALCLVCRHGPGL